MSFGRHWEWRGFAPEAEALVRRVRSLPAVFPDAQVLRDRYLWRPGCPVNVKLRAGDLKLKRRLGDGPRGVEEWIEDEAENWPFPLRPGQVREVARSLGVSPPRPPERPVADGPALIELLRACAPDIRAIEVAKRRTQHRLEAASGTTVELAEISAPEALVSLGIEHPELDRVLAALDALGLPGDLRAMSYLEALDTWGRGERLFPRR